MDLGRQLLSNRGGRASGDLFMGIVRIEPRSELGGQSNGTIKGVLMGGKAVTAIGWDAKRDQCR